MPMAAEEIEGMIKAAFPDATVEITDLRGDGDHYAARVVSAAFKGMPACGSIRRFITRWVAGWAAYCTHCN